jgi:DNA modification methylase
MTSASNRLTLHIQPLIQSNHLYYGDNLTIMKTSIPPNSINLIYLDPPFNSQRNYNLIYKQLTGQPVPEQEEAFCDAWEMDAEKEDMLRRMPVVFEEYGVDEDLVKFWQAWIRALRNTQPRLLAYLVYMFYRLLEMRRILHPHGSIYLHCDPHVSHYIKVIMDGVFGHENFRNEISWKRSGRRSSIYKIYRRAHDVLLFYTKSDKYIFNLVYEKQDDTLLKKYTSQDEHGKYRLVPLMGSGKVISGETGKSWRGFDPNTRGKAGMHWLTTHDKLEEYVKQGRVDFPRKKGGVPQLKYYLHENKGVPASDFWDDIDIINSMAKESLGYPTQKPIALVKRIIEASSNKGDIVFDPFCGCGTAVYAAHLSGRKWIGCDIAILSIDLVRDVLMKRYGLEEGKHYIVDGIPRSVEAAHELFTHDPRQFQHWAVELAGGFASAKFSGDRGIDGRIHFETDEGLKNMVISVKGGNKPTPIWMRELGGVVQREEDSMMGGLICLENPTKGMRGEEASGGIYTYQGRDYHRLQIRTIQDLLNGKWFDTPSMVRTLGKSSQTIMPV